MTTDDVIGEFMRRAPYIDGVAETHYLDATAMAAEIVRLRESVRELETFIDNLVREANA
jgi:hypothetical protein